MEYVNTVTQFEELKLRWYLQRRRFAIDDAEYRASRGLPPRRPLVDRLRTAASGR